MGLDHAAQRVDQAARLDVLALTGFPKEVWLVMGRSAHTVARVNTQPGPAASTCRICHHVQDDHVLVLVLTRPVPMGLMYCPSTGCSCGSTWRAGPNLSTRHEIEETRRLVRDALVADGVPVPYFLR
jgi:hypothetical protein